MINYSRQDTLLTAEHRNGVEFALHALKVPNPRYRKWNSRWITRYTLSWRVVGSASWSQAGDWSTQRQAAAALGRAFRAADHLNFVSAPRPVEPLQLDLYSNSNSNTVA